MLFGYKLSNLSLSVRFCVSGDVENAKNGSFMAKNGMLRKFIGLYEIFHGFKVQVITGKS